MRRLFCLLPLAACLSYACAAQSASGQVLATAGGFDHAAHLTLEWTLGELATETLPTGEGILTQGFHQPLLLVVERESDSALTADAPRITVFPNPSRYAVNVRISGPNSEAYTDLELLDNRGRTVARQTRDVRLDTQLLDVSRLPAGVYHLRVVSGDFATAQTFTVIKIK